MLKTGKYDLFFFSTEDNLILYYSKNKVKKIIAFSIIKTNKLKEIIPLLNQNLKKGIIAYYSVQIVNIPNFAALIFLNFQDITKECIFKSLNMLKNELNTYSIKESISIEFLSKKELNKVFTGIISTELSKDMKIVFENNLNFLKNKEILYYFSVYKMNLINQISSKSVLNILFNLFNDLGINGRLIINFQLKKGKIVVNPYFIEYYQDLQQPSNFKDKAGDFINNELQIKEVRMRNRLIGKWLWRLNISNDYFDYKMNEKIIHSICNLIQKDKKLNKEPQNGNNTSKLNAIDLIKNYLEDNRVKYKQIKSNVFEVNDQYLILIIKEHNPGLIHRIFIKYYPNRTIFLIIEDRFFFKKLISKTKIQNLIGVKIFNSNNFSNLLDSKNIFV